MFYSLEGKWQADIGDGQVYAMNLPGTLDENQIGKRDVGSNQWHPDSNLFNEDLKKDGVILTRLTRKYTFEGKARLTRRVSFALPCGKRLFLEAERARCLRLFLDGREIPDFREPSISTPHVFELTQYWKGDHELMLLSDNSYPGLPHDNIVYSSAATDETQTNWNGVLGYLRLRVEEPVFPEAVQVYPVRVKPSETTLTVCVTLCADKPWRGRIKISSDGLKEPFSSEVMVEKGQTELRFEGLALDESALWWDEYEGNLYELTVSLTEEKEGREVPLTDKTVTFGIREFGDNGQGRLALNGRTIFLRSEANCGEFPETGYSPMSVAEWTEILETYKSYGINCVRFHSHCPGEAAFMAADRMGMLMQPELSHWNPEDAFESEESYSYYERELKEILRMLANHPSFVMLTFGNELHALDKGHERMDALLKKARNWDNTRLYANGSNVHYGNRGCDGESDFYTSSNYYEKELRGTFAGMRGYINHSYPSARTNFDEAMQCLRQSFSKPVFSFEVGQFEVLPDFDELEDFRGISDPANLRWIQKRVEEKGLLPVWKKYVEATGELSRIGYREEIEAALRTRQLSGISLLGLQDFPGQGTALVGMLNSHLKPKPFAFARPEGFREFFDGQRPLVLLPKYTYESTESLTAEVQVANYKREAVEGELCYRLEGKDFSREKRVGRVSCPAGELTDVGTLAFSLAQVGVPVKLELTVGIETSANKVGDNVEDKGTWATEGISARYPVWVYPPVRPVCPEGVYETAWLDERAKEVLETGGKVYLTPPSTKEALPDSIQAQFTTDFWSVGTFSAQEGAMGQLIDSEHPIFRDFPTEFHTNWQWWPMASQRAVILPKRYEAIITQMDSYAYLRPMAQLMECRCGGGKLLFSTMGLQDLQKYPEARALLSSIYRYLASEEFAPEQEIEWGVVEGMVKRVNTHVI